MFVAKLLARGVRPFRRRGEKFLRRAEGSVRNLCSPRIRTSTINFGVAAPSLALSPLQCFSETHFGCASLMAPQITARNDPDAGRSTIITARDPLPPFHPSTLFHPRSFKFDATAKSESPIIDFQFRYYLHAARLPAAKLFRV